VPKHPVLCDAASAKQRSPAFLLAILTALVVATFANLPATEPASGRDAARITQAVVAILEKKHYPNDPLDPALARKVLDQYFDALDPQRLYFTQPDIDRFHRFDQALPADVVRGDLGPAFTIYRYFARQAEARTQAALEMLKREPAFDGNASYRFVRQGAPWARDRQALDRLWREHVENDALTLLLAGRRWSAAVKVLDRRYREGLQQEARLSDDRVFDLFLNAYAKALDPHSAYFSPFQAQQFQIMMSLHFQGIGAELEEQDGYATVMRVLPGGPAAGNGKLKSGDRITGVGSGEQGSIRDVIGWRLDDVVKEIRGPQGTSVRLRILPAGAVPGAREETLTLVRNTIELKAERAHESTTEVTLGDGRVYRIGVITIPSFYSDFQARNGGAHNYRSVTRDVRRLLVNLKNEGVDGILLDLRNNGGGSLDEATALTGLFIPKGPVVQIEGRSGHRDILGTTSAGPVYTGPLALLVNRLSASATEIFTGALKDYHRALVLGSRTWGKGTVQTVVQLGDYLHGIRAGDLKFTTAQFFRVNGASTQLKGVLPDIALPSAVDAHQFGETMYGNALPWTQIAAAPHVPVRDGIGAAMPELERYFSTQVREKSEFKLYLREVALTRALGAREEVPLNLKARQALRERQQAQALEQDNAWRKLQGKPPFESLTAASSGDYEPPDVALDASEQLVGKLIELKSRPRTTLEARN
jgi:carboxyl-terminal processing protease